MRLSSRFRTENPTQTRAAFCRSFNRSSIKQFKVNTQKDSSNRFNSFDRSRRSTNRSVAGTGGCNSPPSAMTCITCCALSSVRRCRIRLLPANDGAIRPNRFGPRRASPDGTSERSSTVINRCLLSDPEDLVVQVGKFFEVRGRRSRA